MPALDLAPPPLPEAPADEPMVSLQSQIGLLVAAILTVIAFIFHRDLSSLTAPLSLIGFAIYGAAVAIARAIKHRTVAQAQMVRNQQKLSSWVEQKDHLLLQRQIEQADKAPAPVAKKTTARKTAARRR